MKKFLLLLNTVKYLKLKQIYFRLALYIKNPRITETFQGQEPRRSSSWKHQLLYEEKIDKNFNVFFLNYKKKINLPTDWNAELPSKLWVYNLHYFDDLIAEGASNKHEFHNSLLDRWVEENPIGHGNAWEPYPSSLRVVNILKAWLGGLNLNNKLLCSVFAQTSFLSNNLEKHLLGNHYLANLKALLFAGIIFENSHWIKIADKNLMEQISEQILEDGANFELSPMYHSLVTVDMLDMYNLGLAYPDRMPAKLLFLIESYLPKMLMFIDSMSHLDNGVSFFNDSVDGIAPSKKIIFNYAKKLGFIINLIDPSITQIIDNEDSGYFCATTSGNKLLFDASPVGPDYIPGHAHADTLSFELSLGNQRVFVNSGISEYGLSQDRLNQRKTKSHNTVEINGKDSSEVWSGFRVGNRARIIDRYSKLNDNSIFLQAAHDGYTHLLGKCTHSRKLTFSSNTLIVNDSIEGTFKNAKSYFHFHPGLEVVLQNNLLIVAGSNFILKSNLQGMKYSINDSLWHPEFGKSFANKELNIEFVKNYLEIIFEWSDK